MIAGVTPRKSQTDSCTFTNLGLFNCCKERKNSDFFFTKNSEFVEVFSAKQETPSKCGKVSNHCCSFAAKTNHSPHLLLLRFLRHPKITEMRNIMQKKIYVSCFVFFFSAAAFYSAPAFFCGCHSTHEFPQSIPPKFSSPKRRFSWCIYTKFSSLNC